MALRVAYQGEPGAYSDAAAAALFGDVGVQALPCPTFAEVFDALAAGSADAAVVPVENSYAGDVGEVYDLLRRGGVRIVLELDLPIRHCLLALPGAAPEDIRVVRSHPQALGQCREFLRRLGLRAEPAHDTAGAARRLAEEGDRQAAAIASERAARAYGLAVLLRDIQDASDNVTRFHVLVPEDGPAEPPGPPTAPWRTAAGGARRKTSLLLATEHRPGALYRCLGVFARWGVNLTKLTSRPYPGRAWEYMFFVDLEGAVEDPPVAGALEELARHAAMVRVFGSYPWIDASTEELA
ncbi:MAG: prephenate dehydratase [Thermaerobacter sp.]